MPKPKGKRPKHGKKPDARVVDQARTGIAAQEPELIKTNSKPAIGQAPSPPVAQDSPNAVIEASQHGENAKREKSIAKMGRRRRCRRRRDGIFFAAQIIGAASTAVVAALTFVMVCYSSGQLETLIEQTVATEMSAEAASASARVAELQTEIANRPWVRTEAAIESFVIDSEGDRHVRLKLRHKNVGNSPATYISHFVALFPLDFTRFTTQLEEEQFDVCRAAQNLELDSARGAPSRLTLFPNDERVEPIEFSLSKAIYDSAMEKGRSSGITGFHPMIALCVFYRFAYDIRRFDRTAYIFAIQPGDSPNTHVLTRWTAGGYEAVGIPPTPIPTRTAQPEP